MAPTQFPSMRRAGGGENGGTRPLALDQFVTRHSQSDAVLGHVRDLIRHDIAVGGKEARTVDPNEAVAEQALAYGFWNVVTGEDRLREVPDKGAFRPPW